MTEVLRLWSADCFLYITDCILVPAGMQQASINLTQSLHEVYEPDWHGKDDVMIIGKVRIMETPIWQGDTWTNRTNITEWTWLLCTPYWTHHTNMTERHLYAPHQHDGKTPYYTVQTWRNDSGTHHINMMERLLSTLYKHEGMPYERIVQKMTEPFLKAHCRTTPKCITGVQVFTALLCLDTSHVLSIFSFVCQCVAMYSNI